jgi:hypothetical protein
MGIELVILHSKFPLNAIREEWTLHSKAETILRILIFLQDLFQEKYIPAYTRLINILIKNAPALKSLQCDIFSTFIQISVTKCRGNAEVNCSNPSQVT